MLQQWLCSGERFLVPNNHLLSKTITAQLKAKWKHVYELQECSGHGRRLTVNQYTGTVNKELLNVEGSDLPEAINMDYAWALIHIGPAHVFETGIAVQDMQPVPTWGGFNSMLCPERPTKRKIGYCPMTKALQAN